MDPTVKPTLSSYTPDELRALYEMDATRFAELADDAIKKACVSRNPAQTLKLQQLQWTIEMQLRKGKTPQRRMQIMEEIFYSQVYGNDGKLSELVSACSSLIDSIREPIVPFAGFPQSQDNSRQR